MNNLEILNGERILIGMKRNKAEASRANLQKALAARITKGRTTGVCHGCGKVCRITKTAVRKGWKYCSWECRKKNMVGSNGANAGGGAWMRGRANINYRHGESANREPRDLTKVNQWRRRVFERDKYKCQRCGYDKGKIFRAHHISPWADFPNLRFDLDNGMTLCDPCHRWVHSKKNMNKEYLKCK